MLSGYLCVFLLREEKCDVIFFGLSTVSEPSKWKSIWRLIEVITSVLIQTLLFDVEVLWSDTWDFPAQARGGGKEKRGREGRRVVSQTWKSSVPR